MVALLPDLSLAVDTFAARGRLDLAAALIVSARRAWWYGGRMAEFVDLTQRVDAVVDEPLAASIVALRGVFLKVLGRPGAIDVLRDGVHRLRAAGNRRDRSVFVDALCHLADMASDAGCTAEAYALADEAVAAAGTDDPALLEMALDLSAYVARAAHDTTRALAVAEAAVASGRAHPTTQLTHGLAGLAAALAAAGRPEEAVDPAVQALAQSDALPSLVQRAEVATVVGEALAGTAPELVAIPLAEAVAAWVAVGATNSLVDAAAALARTALASNPAGAAQLAAAVRVRAPDRAVALDPLLADAAERLPPAQLRLQQLQGAKISDDDMARLAADLAQNVLQATAATS
jgi:hypothetical protein